jgi:hypothetical protein
MEGMQRLRPNYPSSTAKTTTCTCGWKTLRKSPSPPWWTPWETTSLDAQQWLICICVALSIIVVSEVRKAIRRRTAAPVAAGPESPTEG